MTVRWRAIGRARGYSRRALHVIGVAEVRNRHRSRWVLPPWEPLKDQTIRSRLVAGVVLPARCVLIAQRMRGTEHREVEESIRAWRRQLRELPGARDALDWALAEVAESGDVYQMMPWPGEEWSE